MLYSRSTKLCLAGLVCAFAFAGCGSGKRHDDAGNPPPAGGTGYGVFMWNILDIEDINYTTLLTCEQTGGSKVVVTLYNQDTKVSYPQNSVPCANGRADLAGNAQGYMSTAEVPAGRYFVSFDLYGDPTIYGSEPLLASYPDPDPYDIYPGMNDFLDYYAPLFVQSLIVQWGFVSGSAASYCAVLGVPYVDLDFLSEGSATWVTSRFYCASGAGASFPLPYDPTDPDPYVQWQLVLVDALDQEIAVLPGGTVLLPVDTDVNVGMQTFPF